MKINSGYFGEVTIDEDKIITVDPPIPGFPDSSKYFIITEDDEESGESEEDRLFCWLHSAEDENTAFALLDVFKIKEDYEPEIDGEYLAQVKYEDGDNIAVYNIVNIPEVITDMTVNLLAPLIFNFTKMRGMQIILGNGNFNLKHKIFDDLRKSTESNQKKG